ncbi:bacterioferritin-associated ferredoxin [uncultured Bdellovibrio sp.]|uniref:(2Fe-2S)-binding protein n=1 Tax=Bdellovibrio sp. HCB-162 TaxID=3394234 RepID=UPI002600AE0D|nr:(2Fe-2S)-binding protein [uncultured Bdellovibrio sp.]
MGPKKKTEIICRCNNISRETIEEAIRNGAHTLNEIFDTTSAGVGPCGGSCRRKLGPLLEYYLKHGEFPEKIVEDMTGKEPKKAGS